MTDDGMVRFLLDQLDDPGVSARAMFGGHGIYEGGKMFALVYNDAVYMKVDDEEAARSEREPFRPSPDRTFPTFREVPAEVLEHPEGLRSYASSAQRAAKG